MAKWPAEVQQPICTHMNDEHADVVLAFARRLADQRDATHAELVGIDADGLRIIAHTVHGDERLMVPFHPPLSGYDEARERLVAMASALTP